MSLISRISLVYKSLYELGFSSLALNGLYRFGLVTGHYKRILNAEVKRIENRKMESRGDLFPVPPVEELIGIIGEGGKAKTLAEADEIVRGKVRPFCGDPVELKLTLDGPLVDWTAYEKGKVDLKPLTPDVKFLWEPARFGWAFTLGRAFQLTGRNEYAEIFWRYFETFTQANPPYLGPHWMSGQESALRLMAFAWADQIFAGSFASTAGRRTRLTHSIAEHAARIPPTLVYARSQQNNHLLVEAAGLFTAGLALPEHPRAQKWAKVGWTWLNRGLQDQVDSYGEYSQHSTNYHRLMLEVVLWVTALIRNNHLSGYYRWPRPTVEALLRSVHWLLALLDPDSGRVPNLGANDGAYILPMTVCPFEDFRPVLCAAARAFLDYDLPHGPWDELSLWFGVLLADKRYVQLPRYLGDHLYGRETWAYLRTAQFKTRPSHADQLHLDLWWRGLNLAWDAGTYRYNAEPPWENSLTTARVHNTVTVDGHDQMTRAGRFLYVDWINAYGVGSPTSDPNVVQQVCGRYRNFHQGYRHTRRVTVFTDDRWEVEDDLLPIRWLPMNFARRTRSYRLHWLLPDWEWEAEDRESGFELKLKSPNGWITLRISGSKTARLAQKSVSLVRAGENLYGSTAADPIRGWTSPTYGVKVPALSLAVEIRSADAVQFVSEFIFP